ncbi:glutamate--tRNA ligase [Candidatus Woesearchaeota archaeon]|nr:glutamate--tRNA ligase [Candidatus Woesearchaeota archaeon]
MEIDTIVRKYVLQNAVRYEGKADPGRIMSKVLGENPDLRSNAKEITQKIKAAVKKVNAMSLDKQRAELEKIAPEFLEEKSTRREGLKELPGAQQGKVVMRFEPSPSGPLHIGHAYVLSLNYEYAKKYNGKFILRISDTNPDNIDIMAYEQIPQDARWLCDNDNFDVLIQSDRMEIYYKYALQLIQHGCAYVCTCKVELVRELLAKSEACQCRNFPATEHVKRWHKMNSGYAQGEAVVRFKTDIGHKNPAMRDFSILRINETEHPRQGRKYRVWPLMNFAVAIDDMETGVTHTLRGKDHADNALRQKFMHEALGYKTPEPISVGRINFEGFEVSCSKTREKIEAGSYNGWDDIRIPFIPALRCRGYNPIAFRKYAMDVGVTRNDKSVTMEEFFKTVNAFNKQLIDSVSERYYFVKDPIMVTVENAPEMTVELDLHPDNKKGGRVLHTRGTFYLDADDELKDGKAYRLLELFNFKIRKGKLIFTSTKYDKAAKDTINVHWVCDDDPINVEITMPDGTTVKGRGEKWLNDVSVDQVVQFERFGFVRCDSITQQKMTFWFLHK